VTETQRLELLRRLGEELRAAFAEERVAIGKLDNAKLAQLAVLKQAIASQLAQLQPTVTPTRELGDLFAAIRIEAKATAMLAAVAADAVRNLLGYEPTGYDRRARRTANSHGRILATY
jgi:hypothetical protein